jgi:hypothetical protein
MGRKPMPLRVPPEGATIDLSKPESMIKPPRVDTRLSPVIEESPHYKNEGRIP